MTDLINFLEDHNACDPGYDWVLNQPDQSLEAIWQTCPRGDWLLWLHEEAGTPWDVLEPVVYLAVNRAFKYAEIDFGEVTPENVDEAVKAALTAEAATNTAKAAYWAVELVIKAAELVSAATWAAEAAYWATEATSAAAEHLLCADDCRELLPLPKI